MLKEAKTKKKNPISHKGGALHKANLNGRKLS